MRISVSSPCLLVLLASLFTGWLRAEEVAWPGVEYAYAKGYFYVPGSSLSQSILENGRLHPGVERIVPISTDDVAKIQAAFVVPEKGKMRARKMCYTPHHAFIFFDSARQRVAHLELCFQCSNHQASPPLSEAKIVDYNALAKLCVKLGLPQYGEFQVAAEPKARAEEQARLATLSPHLESLELAAMAKSSPPMEHAWPWQPVAKVKICLFNENGLNPYLVHLGAPNSSISKTLELSKEQQARVWTAFTAESQLHHLSPAVRLRFSHSGMRNFTIEGLDVFHDFTSDERSIRRGLICFDEHDKPVAWLAFSERDGNRLMHPGDTCPGAETVMWDSFKLGRVFDELGLTVPPKAEPGGLK